MFSSFLYPYLLLIIKSKIYHLYLWLYFVLVWFFLCLFYFYILVFGIFQKLFHHLVNWFVYTIHSYTFRRYFVFRHLFQLICFPSDLGVSFIYHFSILTVLTQVLFFSIFSSLRFATFCVFRLFTTLKTLFLQKKWILNFKFLYSTFPAIKLTFFDFLGP